MRSAEVDRTRPHPFVRGREADACEIGQPAEQARLAPGPDGFEPSIDDIGNVVDT